jgi:protein-tyrosine phosphatase
MSPCEPLFDTHCHLLAGLDDGPADWVESLEMARCAASDGIGGIVATPHQWGAYAANTPGLIRKMTGELRRLLGAEGIALQVFPGAEVRLEPDLAQRLRKGEAVTLADRGRHVLVELPHELYVPCEKVLEQLRRNGLLAVLAHPERNFGVRRQPDVLRGLADRGCLLQVTAGSLLGKFGSGARQLAEQLISSGMVQLVASDAHGMRERRPVLTAAYEQITKLWGETAAARLCRENPARIIEGNDTLSVRPETLRSTWGSWFRWRAAG